MDVEQDAREAGHSGVQPVADTEGGGAGGACPPLEAHIRTLPLQKSVESKAGKRDFKKIPSF